MDWGEEIYDPKDHLQYCPLWVTKSKTSWHKLKETKLPITIPLKFAPMIFFGRNEWDMKCVIMKTSAFCFGWGWGSQFSLRTF
jgi:hypothetical protein